VSVGANFASDNWSGICPEAWVALSEANTGHAPAYGGDDWTAAAVGAIRQVFDTECDVFFVFTGTAANSIGLASMVRSTDAIVCSANAHINVDECGAPGFFSGGAKLLTAETPDAKITIEMIDKLAVTPHDVHSSRPSVVALTQATEFGTLYTPLEMWRIAEVAHARGMRVHVDGARFANAVASLGCEPADISWRAGVDVLSLGGTKNGLPFGEAVVFFDRTLAQEFGRRRMQGGSSRRRCAISRRRGSACCATERGFAMQRTPTPWRGGSPMPSPRCPVPAFSRRSRRMACSWTCRWR
jgi:threonine aldolase